MGGLAAAQDEAEPATQIPSKRCCLSLFAPAPAGGGHGCHEAASRLVVPFDVGASTAGGEAWSGLRKKSFGSGQKTSEEALAARLYNGVVERTADIIRDPKAQALAARHGLQILDVSWEDTGRDKGSAMCRTSAT